LPTGRGAGGTGTRERRWTGSPQASPTAEEATAGLDPDAPQAEVQFHHHEARPAAPDGGAGGDL